MTNNNQTHTNYPSKKGPAKPLTDYAPELALKRTRFYLDVMEAHFQMMEAFFQKAKGEGKKFVPNTFRTPDLDALDSVATSEHDERT
jgi:hypothetical protein